MPSEHTIPAVEKTVAILNRLGESSEGMTQAELAAELDITSSSCYRILQTLLESDYVRKVNGTRYDLSFGILGAVRKLTDSTARFAEMTPILEELAQNTQLGCKLSIRQGDFQVTLLRAESPRPVAISGKIGARFPVAEGSVGAALLLNSPEAEIKKFAASCAKETLIKDALQQLCDGIAMLKSDGYCFNRGRNRWKVDAMSAPIKNAQGDVIAALTLLGYDEDFSDERMPLLSCALLASVKKCERTVGYL
ncbi:MAG: helix-turn-helix domain-containing protein [Victivallales bacterium]|jgi:DNA-binding IclR family transcriptional regulator|nr:helix-turn-helix domain-containing protein [Victivallales bacterium]